MESPLSRVVIKGFKSIKEVDLRLHDINLLIGSNGAGKSNFISFFRMLEALIDERLGEYVGKAGGANSLLHYGRKQTEAIEVELHFWGTEYAFSLSPTAEDSFVFGREEVRSHDDEFGEDFDYVPGHREAHTPGWYESEGFDGESASGQIVESIKSWRVYHFHDTSQSASVKQTGDVHVNGSLRSDAGNLAAFLYRLRRTNPNGYERIRSVVRHVFPKFGDFVLAPEEQNEDKIRLLWRESGSDYPFLADQLSDGTLRFICLATVLLQPKRFMPATMLIDEPELGLHPAALATLAELVREAARHTQLILSTQSVSFIDSFEPEEIVTVDREPGEEGATTFRRHSSEELSYWLNEYSLSEVWEKNIIGGRP